MPTTKRAASGAGSGLDDDIAPSAASAPPLIENGAAETPDAMLRALVALLSIAGLGGPRLFRALGDPGLDVVAVASPYVVALLLAGRLVAKGEAGALHRRAFRGGVIAVGLIAFIGALSAAVMAKTHTRLIVIAVSIFGAVALMASELKFSRLALFVLALAAVALTFPLVRLLRVYIG